MMEMPPRRERIFNVPGAILALLTVLGVIHAVREFILSDPANLQVLLRFAFIPARYDSTLLATGTVPGGIGADIWTFVTYAFLHGDWVHLGVNAAWLLAFGSPLARRFGALRLFAFFAVTAIGGSVAHLISHSGELAPMIGASASISGMMAAAMRFVFQPGGPLRQRWGQGGDDNIPALPLTKALRDPRILAFLVVWLGVNLLFGLGGSSLIGENQSVAWEAHVGGFFAGLLLFDLFDRQRPVAPPLAPGDDRAAT